MDVNKVKMNFVKKFSLMCRAHKGCGGCPLQISSGCLMGHDETETTCRKTVELVEYWANEHLQKMTILDDFLEKYPNAIRNSQGFPVMRPCDLGYINSESCPNDCTLCWKMLMEE